MTALALLIRRSGLATTASLLLMLTAGSALAAIPGTADWRNATQPMITGRVVQLSEHGVVVATEQGGEAPLTMDSNTMLPADLSQDMMVRIEFHYRDDGTRLAKRIIPIRHGQRITRELAYSQERDDDQVVARYAMAYAEPEPRPSRVASATNQPLGTPLRPIPSTDEYKVATTAMVVGRVIAATDHRVVIDTDQGQRVALEMDSRTLVPTDLQSGIGVRVEYTSLDNGAHLAKRIVPIRFDRHEGEQVTMEQDLAYPTDEELQQMPDAQTAEYEDQGDDSDHDAMMAADVGDHDADADHDDQMAADEDEGALPTTSSQEPLLVLLGLLALGTGAAFMLRRHSHVG